MKRLNIDIDDLIKRYLAGESENAIAKSLGVDRSAIKPRLIKAGVKRRGRSEAELLKWSKLSIDARRRQTASANRAARGRVRGFPELRKQAHARQMGGAQSTYELQLINLLLDLGVDVVPQQAIGPYNCDLGIYPVAVEVFGGGWHFSGRHLARTPKRIRYLMDRGWSILMIVVDPRRNQIITGITASDVHSYVKLMRGQPPPSPEYRVVRSTGETMTKGSFDDDERTIMETFCGRKDFRN